MLKAKRMKFNPMELILLDFILMRQERGKFVKIGSSIFFILRNNIDFSSSYKYQESLWPFWLICIWPSSILGGS